MASEYSAYRDAYSIINPAPCPFEKAILTRCVTCTISEKHLLAERETINCRNLPDWRNCIELRKILQTRATFSLKLVKYPGEIPHGKEIKIQCGGLQGLQQIIMGDIQLINVAPLIHDALARYGNLESFPYTEIARAVVHYHRARRK